MKVRDLKTLINIVDQLNRSGDINKFSSYNEIIYFSGIKLLSKKGVE